MANKSFLLYVAAAGLLAGCNKGVVDANQKRCNFTLHTDFYTQRADIEQPLVFGLQRFGAKIVYRHRAITGRMLELYADDQNGNGELSLKEVTNYRLTQDHAPNGTKSITCFDRKKNEWLHYTCTSQNDTLAIKRGWGGLDGRAGDPVMEFLNPNHYIKRPALDMAAN